MRKQRFIEISRSLFVDPDYEAAFGELGLTSIDAVFSFAAAKNLAKDSLARHRARLQFEIGSPPTTVFLKRYDRPAILTQLRAWIAAHRRTSCGLFEVKAVNRLAAAGIKTPKILFYGEQWGIFFEKRSFIALERIPDAESLERKLPDYFDAPASTEDLRLRRDFIARLADFVKRFHQTGCRHRDLYFCFPKHRKIALREILNAMIRMMYQRDSFAESFLKCASSKMIIKIPGKLPTPY